MNLQQNVVRTSFFCIEIVLRLPIVLSLSIIFQHIPVPNGIQSFSVVMRDTIPYACIPYTQLITEQLSFYMHKLYFSNYEIKTENIHIVRNYRLR